MPETTQLDWHCNEPSLVSIRTPGSSVRGMAGSHWCATVASPQSQQLSWWQTAHTTKAQPPFFCCHAPHLCSTSAAVRGEQHWRCQPQGDVPQARHTSWVGAGPLLDVISAPCSRPAGICSRQSTSVVATHGQVYLGQSLVQIFFLYASKCLSASDSPFSRWCSSQWMPSCLHRPGCAAECSAHACP